MCPCWLCCWFEEGKGLWTGGPLGDLLLQRDPQASVHLLRLRLLQTIAVKAWEEEKDEERLVGDSACNTSLDVIQVRSWLQGHAKVEKIPSSLDVNTPHPKTKQNKITKQNNKKQQKLKKNTKNRPNSFITLPLLHILRKYPIRKENKYTKIYILHRWICYLLPSPLTNN